MDRAVWHCDFSLAGSVRWNVTRTLFRTGSILFVGGSPPVGSLPESGRVAQLVRAPALQAGGRRFESSRAHLFCAQKTPPALRRQDRGRCSATVAIGGRPEASAGGCAECALKI